MGAEVEGAAVESEVGGGGAEGVGVAEDERAGIEGGATGVGVVAGEGGRAGSRLRHGS